MEQLVRDALGPAAPWLTALSFAAVVAMRKRIRKRHLVVLVLITALALVGMLVLLVFALAGKLEGVPSAVFWTVFRLLAALVAVCGPAVGFWLMLKYAGFVPDETLVVLPRSRLPRKRV